MRSHPNPFIQPYWDYPAWQAELLLAIQSKVHLPDNEDTPGLHGTVRFLFDDGVIKNPVIVASTGVPKLDTLMLQQIVTAQIPKPYGQNTNQPHEFQLSLEMLTPYKLFEYHVYASIDKTKLYGRDAIISVHTGITAVDFDYLDGIALNITVAKSSGHADLDRSSVETVSKAELPAAPPGYVGKTLHMQVIVCYEMHDSFNQTNNCPVGENIIAVVGTRIRRTYTTYN